jgi:hypothetical protein
VDPIHPIAPGPPSIGRAERTPVQRPERISRERDRPPQERPGQEQRRKPPPPREQDEDDGERPRIDVRV